MDIPECLEYLISGENSFHGDLEIGINFKTVLVILFPLIEKVSRKKI
jgi:hypothetical protein